MIVNNIPTTIDISLSPHLNIALPSPRTSQIALPFLETHDALHSAGQKIIYHFPCRFVHHNSPTTTAINANPPTTTPAIAPGGR